MRWLECISSCGHSSASPSLVRKTRSFFVDSLAGPGKDDDVRTVAIVPRKRVAISWNNSAASRTSRHARSPTRFFEHVEASSWKSAAWAGAAGRARCSRAWPFSRASRRRRLFHGCARPTGKRPWRRPTRKHGFDGSPAGQTAMNPGSMRRLIRKGRGPVLPTWRFEN